MNSRESAHAEDRDALATLTGRPVRIIAIALIGMFLVGLAYVVVSQNQNNQLQEAASQAQAASERANAAAAAAKASADQARAQALAGCRLYKLIADGPLQALTSPFAINASVGARVAYATAECELGPLLPADPRVAALLPPGVH